MTDSLFHGVLSLLLSPSLSYRGEVWVLLVLDTWEDDRSTTGMGDAVLDPPFMAGLANLQPQSRTHITLHATQGYSIAGILLLYNISFLSSFIF